MFSLSLLVQKTQARRPGAACRALDGRNAARKLVFLLRGALWQRPDLESSMRLILDPAHARQGELQSAEMAVFDIVFG